MSKSSTLSDATSYGGTRWWEFYAVRYAMGSVVGAVIVYELCTHVSALTPLLLMPAEGTTNKAAPGIGQLPLLAALGLTYCYVASAPILLLHAGRFLINFEPQTFSWQRLGWILFCLAVASALAGCVNYWNPSRNGTAATMSFMAVTLLLFVVGLQLVIVWATLRNTAGLYSFYKKLAARRVGNAEIVESYRHLREHGNSFAIVLCEICLGSLLLVVSTPSTSASQLFGGGDGMAWGIALITFLWVIPAACIWLIATGLERRFMKDSG